MRVSVYVHSWMLEQFHCINTGWYVHVHPRTDHSHAPTVAVALVPHQVDALLVFRQAHLLAQLTLFGNMTIVAMPLVAQINTVQSTPPCSTRHASFYSADFEVHTVTTSRWQTCVAVRNIQSLPVVCCKTIAAMAQAQQASPVRSLLMNTRINVLLQQRGVIIVPQESTVEQALQVCALQLQQEWCT